MEYLILGAFLGTIIYVVIRNLIRYGKDNDTFEIIISDIIRLRGLFFMFLWIWICISMITKIEDISKWYLLPFILCGISIILMMYEKTKKIGLISFGIIFFGSIFLAILIGIFNNNSTVELAPTLFMIFVFSVLLGFFVYSIVKNK